MVKASAYSLWLMPEPELSDRLARIISQLSQQYSGPLFSPHVTLLEKVQGREEDVRRKTEALARALRTYEIHFKDLDYTDEFFRALFVRAGKTPDVMEANTLARKFFEIKNARPYMPHLSLFYGNLPVETKKSIIAHLGEAVAGRFKVGRIHLFSTSGATDGWYEVASFPVK
jgi:2'-5' RNA ligase